MSIKEINCREELQNSFIEQTRLVNGLEIIDAQRTELESLSKYLTERIDAVREIKEKRGRAERAAKDVQKNLLKALPTANSKEVSISLSKNRAFGTMQQVAAEKLRIQRDFCIHQSMDGSYKSHAEFVEREKEIASIRVEKHNVLDEEQKDIHLQIMAMLNSSPSANDIRKIQSEQDEAGSRIHNLENEKQGFWETFNLLKANLKAESKKPFKSFIVECAKLDVNLRSLETKCNVLSFATQRLEKEVATRRSQKSFDETIQFDCSFIQISQGPVEHNTNIPRTAERAFVEPRTNKPTPVATATPILEKKNEKADAATVVAPEADPNKSVYAEDESMDEQPSEEGDYDSENEEDNHSNPETNVEMENIEERVEENVEENEVGEQSPELRSTSPESFFSNLLNGAQKQSGGDQPMEGAANMDERPGSAGSGHSSISDAVLNISMHSDDAAGDLISAFGKSPSQTPGQANEENFSFSFFGNTADKNNGQKGASDDVFNFNFEDSGDAGNTQPFLFKPNTSNDPFGFDKDKTNTCNDPFGFDKDKSFDFNFDTSSNKKDGGGNDDFNFLL